VIVIAHKTIVEARTRAITRVALVFDVYARFSTALPTVPTSFGHHPAMNPTNMT